MRLPSVLSFLTGGRTCSLLPGCQLVMVCIHQSTATRHGRSWCGRVPDQDADKGHAIRVSQVCCLAPAIATGAHSRRVYVWYFVVCALESKRAAGRDRQTLPECVYECRLCDASRCCCNAPSGARWPATMTCGTFSSMHTVCTAACTCFARRCRRTSCLTLSKADGTLSPPASIRSAAVHRSKLQLCCV